MLLLRQRNKAANEARLILPAGNRSFPHSSFRRPPRFSDQYILARKLTGDLFTDFSDVGHGTINRYRIVFPVGQDVNGHKINDRSNLRMFQPEFPHIGVGYRDFRQGRFDLPDISGKLLSGNFAAEQCLVADHDCLDAGRMLSGKLNDFLQFLLSHNGIGAHPCT